MIYATQLLNTTPLLFKRRYYESYHLFYHLMFEEKKPETETSSSVDLDSVACSGAVDRSAILARVEKLMKESKQQDQIDREESDSDGGVPCRIQSITYNFFTIEA